MKNKPVNYVPLPSAKVKKIKQILEDVWKIPPHKKAALALRAAGFTTHDLWRYSHSKTASVQPEEWTNNTLNSLRDIEILGKLADN